MTASEPAAGARSARELRDVKVVGDKSATMRSDEGFLKVRRLTLVNVYADGEESRPYACDVVSRRQTDAVAVVLYETERGGDGRRREVRVALKTGLRAPVWLRRRLALVQPDSHEWSVLAEIVAGLLEPGDSGAGGIERRASHEIEEEAGLSVPPGRVTALGAESFPSPGITDEKVHFRAAEVPLTGPLHPKGDGSVMEEGGGVALLPLREAIAMCRRGEIPDMKTEIGLLRLADAVGYVPSLDRFVEDLPPDLRARYAPPGLFSPAR